jgi:O-antigen ligase
VSADLARVGGPIAAAGLALLFVGTRRDLRLAGLGAWAVGCALLAAYVAPSGHTKIYAVAAVVGAAGAVGIAELFRRWPWLVAVSALACAPARIPVHIGSTDSNLLLPMYAVIVGAAVLIAWELARGDRRSRELGPLAWPLAGLVAWSGLSLAWSEDLHEGSVSLLFFWLPFGVLALALARLAWNRRWLTFLYAQLVLMALAFSVIGVYQYATRDVFWNPKVIVGNAYAPFYRVNSVFYDPSVYGRFLVVAILAALVMALYDRERRAAYAATIAIAGIWVGLLFSFSQSSFAAMIVGTALVAAFTWRWRAALALGIVSAVILAVALGTPHIRHSLLRESGTGLNKASSGRAKLVTQGLRIAIHHPVQGVGIGGFKHAYAKRVGLKGREPRTAASHNTAVTVAAETGLPGLGLLAWLLGVALFVTLRRAGASFKGRSCLVIAAGLAAIGLHSLFYNALFEDPVFWGLLGLTALCSGLPVRRWAAPAPAQAGLEPSAPKAKVTASAAGDPQGSPVGPLPRRRT